MSQSFPGRVRFLTEREGGRASAPPRGPRFVTTAVPELGHEEAPVGWPWTGPQFSVVLDLLGAAGHEWTRVQASALAPEAIEASALRPGARLLLLEGPKPLAQLRIDD